jgi:hypothetical protein
MLTSSLSAAFLNLVNLQDSSGTGKVQSSVPEASVSVHSFSEVVLKGKQATSPGEVGTDISDC